MPIPLMSFLPLWLSALSKRLLLRPAWAGLLASADRADEGLPALPAKLPATLPGWLGWSGYTLGCFVIFLLWTFPTEVILGRVAVSLVHKAGVHVDYRHGTLAWPGQVVLREVVMTRPMWAAAPQLQFSQLAVHPSLLGLFRDPPLPLRLEATGYGGEGWAAIDQTADGLSVEFVLRHLALERLPLPTSRGDTPVSGRLTARGTLQGNLQDFADFATLNGSVLTQITDGVVPESTVEGIRLPALQTLAATLEAEFFQGRAVVHTGKLITDGVEAHVQGSITLRTPLAQSRLDLEFHVKKTGTPPAALASLISLLPDSAGSGGRASITGVLGAPQVRSVR